MIDLNRNYISSEVARMLLSCFEHLSNGIAESLLTEELFRLKTAIVFNIEATEVENLDVLACQIDRVLDKYKSEIITEIQEVIENFQYVNGGDV